MSIQKDNKVEVKHGGKERASLSLSDIEAKRHSQSQSESEKEEKAEKAEKPEKKQVQPSLKPSQSQNMNALVAGRLRVELDEKWTESFEAQDIINSSLTRRQCPHTRTLGCLGTLDFKSSPPGVERIACKVIFVGQAGAGKTATIATVSGTEVPQSYVETLGLHVSSCEWPCRTIAGKTYLVDFSFWDIGTSSFDLHVYLRKGWSEDADLVVYVCSATDAKSLQYVQVKMAEDRSTQLPKMVVATRNDQWTKRLVSDIDLQELSKQHGVATCRVANIVSESKPYWQRSDVKTVLNMMASMALKRR